AKQYIAAGGLKQSAPCRADRIAEAARARAWMALAVSKSGDKQLMICSGAGINRERHASLTSSARFLRGLHGCGRDADNLTTFADRLLVVIDQIDDLPMFGGQAGQCLAQQLAAILCLQGGFRVIRWVRDSRLDRFVELRVPPPAARRQCLEAGNRH